MTTELEDRFREVLRDRSGDVVRPHGWDARLLKAGRRRLARRRAGVVTSAAIAVVVVLLAGGVLLPGTLSGVEPARPSDKHGSIEPDELPIGAFTTTAHATLPPHGDRSTTVFFGEHEWNPGRVAVANTRNVAGGVVAHVKQRPTYQLMFRGEDGTTKGLAQGEPQFAVSPNGTKIAWLDMGPGLESESTRADLVLAELPSGRVVRTMPVDLTDPVWAQTRPEVHGFLGDQVVVTVWQGNPVIWDPNVAQLRPLTDAPQGREWLLAGTSDVTGSALFIDREGCLHSLPLAGQGASEQWRRCDLGEQHALKLSVHPDGRIFMATAGDTIAIHDLATGRPLWSRTLTAGINWEATFAELRIVSGVRIDDQTWESRDKLLISYTTGLFADGLSLLRCDIRQRVCERVPTKDRAPVMAFGNLFPG